VDQRVTFGVFELEATSGTLWRNGRPVRLQRQPAKTLAALVAQPGEIVDRAASFRRTYFKKGVVSGFSRTSR
jgi:DNA-binding winged helix-turn-helix (wHTH) protein